MYHDTTLAHKAPTMTAKTRAMLHSLRLDTRILPASGSRAPACVHSATLTHFIAGPLACILRSFRNKALR